MSEGQARRVPRELQSLPYIDPERLLVDLRRIELELPLQTLRYAASSLRARELKRFGEGRQAALFCYGMSKLLGLQVQFAQAESKDFDIIARYVVNDEVSYVPVQLKEWVPGTVNPQASLQSEIDKLAKYADSKDLVVAFYLNRRAQVTFSELRSPEGRLGELWFFWAADPSQSRWMLSGNMLDANACSYDFLYPTG
jgi:hypothetical protein